MAPAPGRKDSSAQQPDSLLAAGGRMLGFTVLAGLGLAIIAAVVLLPAYARMEFAGYERDCDKIAVAEMQATVAANAKLIADMPSSPVLTKRLAMGQGDLMPDNEVIVPPAGATRPPPDVVIPVRYPRPEPPAGWEIIAAAKIQRLSTRRGLLLLAVGALMVAMFLFAPPEKYAQA